ncbi:BTB/POZ domain-containing protein KCTD6 [Stylophora pistillata]|uniref:BTB/POZ domain-containing protein KCTD6 n=1 Tax=Stylophora pistillata TaxID=50429 RepID=A0A2B4RS27_STYPI|nr:BTB/POZ domain-containing protein KCTD6 [Stylophora pistillata]
MSSSQKLEEVEEDDRSGDEAFEEASKRMKEAFDILNRQSKKTRREMEAFDNAAKKLKRVHFQKTLRLNVGGFDTKLGEDGCYFIDRDGTHFRYILNYLRTGKLVIPDDQVICKELLYETEFFQIQGIITELKAKPFTNSVILSSYQRKTLIEWLKDTLTSASHDDVLLYRASRDGWNASNFHSCCDNEGPTVAEIKSGNYIFGGYTEEQWESPGTGIYKSAPASFLFSLVNPYGLPPTKIPLLDGREGNAIYCQNLVGPVFGGGNAHDLYISNTPHYYSNSANLKHAYRCPEDQNASSFFVGSQNFAVNKMEVFGFEK